MAGTCNDYINLANKEMGNINVSNLYLITNFYIIFEK